MQTIWPIPKIQLVPLEEVVERRPVALVTSGPAWNAVEEKLRLPVAWKVEPVRAALDHWDQVMDGLRGEVVYAVGGGLAADAAKYISARAGLPLVCVPTALSVDAFLTWASGIREEGCVRYIQTKPPETLLVDFAVIAAAPPSIRAAGICDVLSIATGLWDWRFAGERGKNPPEMAFVPYAGEAAAALCQGALDCAGAAGRGDPGGLKQLLDCLALEVQLTNQLGHSRPEEGSEHYFAYAAENETGLGWPHADLLGPGILLMLAAQGQDPLPYRRGLDAANIPLQRIPEAVIRKVLHGLPAYCLRHSLPYGIAHEFSDEMIAQLELGPLLSS